MPASSSSLAWSAPGTFAFSETHGGDGKALALLFKRDVGSGFHLLGGELGFAEYQDSAMVKQAACAAPINSSGFEPGLPSKRLAKP